MNDSLFLPFDVSKHSEAKELQRELKDYNIARQDQIKPTGEKDLLAYHTKKTDIAVKKFKGHLISSVNVNKDLEECEGLRLRFVLEKNEDGVIP